MKDLLAVVLLACAVSAERPAPYPARGWKPNGPAFELPQNANQNPQTQYLPPVDPRNPLQPVDAEEDISVQGLPATEQTPQFQLSPISGQQYVGPTFNADLRSLDEQFRQSQTQQQTINQIARQRQLYTASSQTSQSTPIPPSQFVPRTTKTPEATTETSKAATPNQDEISLNQEEILNDDDQSVPAKQKVSVEVSKQNIQEYPPEIFLAPLAQLRVQGYAGQPFGQLVFQPSLSESSQKQNVNPGFDGLTHLSALQSVLLQRQSEQQRLVQNQQLLQRKGSQQGFVQGQYSENQYQPLIQPQIQQYQLQPVLLQSPAQLNQAYGQPEAKEQTKDDDDDEDREMVEDQGNQNQPQFQQPQYVQQPQLVIQQQSYQPQEVQFQPEQAFQIQQQAIQPQQQSFQPQQQAFQPQQQAFQPQQQTFQPQQQAFQPQQQAYQPQQQAYQPQQQAFQPQQQAYQPQQQTYQPQQQMYQTQQQAFQPEQAFQVQQQTFQPQQQAFQPQQALQQQMFQLQQVYQPQQYQPQDFQPAQQQIYQPGLTQDLQQQQQNQVALQSGLNPNMQGNDIDQPEEEDDDGTQEGVAVAMATAFGARTRPRVSTQYGVPVPRVQSTTNSDVQDEEQEPTTEAAVTAEATSVAGGSRRKSAKLRSRRVRPVFTIDNSGHLVLAKEQEKRQ